MMTYLRRRPRWCLAEVAVVSSLTIQAIEGGEPQSDRTDCEADTFATRETDWQIGRRKLCPRLCPNGVYPRQTPSVTGRHGAGPPGGQVVETTAENVIRYFSTLSQRSAFQACAFSHSAISPFRINHLRILDRAKSDLCPGLCPNPSGAPHILTGYQAAIIGLIRRVVPMNPDEAWLNQGGEPSWCRSRGD